MAVLAPVDTAHAKLSALVPFRSAVRPSNPASFGQHVSNEMANVSTTTTKIVEAVQSLTPVIDTMLPEPPDDGRIYGRKNGEWVALS